MCFSEDASFAAAAALAVVGALSFRKVAGQPTYYALAAIPLLFALQQGAEGVQWLYQKKVWGSVDLALFCQYLFLTIACVVWPFWIPFSLWMVEGVEKRKRVLKGMAVIGGILGLYNAWELVAGPVTSAIVNKSIQYDVPISENFIWPYLVLVLLPWFISSFPRSRTQGTIFLIATLVASWLYEMTFLSVWCFTAAIVSIWIYFILPPQKAAE